MRAIWKLPVAAPVATIAAAMLSAGVSAHEPEIADQEKSWSLVIHGGAGTISRDKLTEEKDAEIRASLTQALTEGEAVLAQGGTATDAVIAAIIVLEDDPNFNAGKGAVLTWDGDFSLDSSIMEGDTRNAGAAAGASATKNPILLAQAVMNNSRHVLLSGDGADAFSKEQGLEQVDQDYYRTPRREKALEAFKRRANATARNTQNKGAPLVDALGRDHRFGTVGAVARDQSGNIAAGTSTGGMTGKRWGRIGDSPIIGAGTYADNRSCGISATGSGEFFIRVGVAQEFCTRVRIGAETGELNSDQVQEIADDVIGEMGDLGGSGGVIYLTPWGHSGFSFDTPGMYRGVADSADGKRVAIYADEGE